MISRREDVCRPSRCLLRGVVFAMFMVNLAWAQARPAPPPDGQLAVPGRPGWSVDAGSGCWVWNANPKLLQIVVWAGGCGADGPAIGQGVREWHTDGKMTSRYEGEMQEGKPNGQGVITAADGSRYEGEFRNGKFNGRGVMTTANGSRYEGEFRDGKLNGNGFLTAPNGYRYEGEFRNGKANGQGVVIFPTGRRYGGKWRDGCLRAGGTWVAAVGRQLSECR